MADHGVNLIAEGSNWTVFDGVSSHPVLKRLPNSWSTLLKNLPATRRTELKAAAVDGSSDDLLAALPSHGWAVGSFGTSADAASAANRAGNKAASIYEDAEAALVSLGGTAVIDTDSAAAQRSMVLSSHLPSHRGRDSTARRSPAAVSAATLEALVRDALEAVSKTAELLVPIAEPREVATLAVACARLGARRALISSSEVPSSQHGQRPWVQSWRETEPLEPLFTAIAATSTSSRFLRFAMSPRVT